MFIIEPNICSALRTNSKATLRLKLKDLLPLVPDLLHERLRSSRYYALRSDSLVIQSDGSRKQASNVQECHDKLQEVILEAGKSTIRGETAPEKLAKLKRM